MQFLLSEFCIVNLCKTHLEETGCFGNPYFLLTGCLSIQFFDSAKVAILKWQKQPFKNKPSKKQPFKKQQFKKKPSKKQPFKKQPSKK